MPGLNGFEVLEALASRTANVPVVVITAHDEPGTEERVRTLGVAAYLRKPVDEMALLSAVTTAVSGAGGKELQ